MLNQHRKTFIFLEDILCTFCRESLPKHRNITLGKHVSRSGDHSCSTFAKFPGKLTFLIPYVTLRIFAHQAGEGGEWSRHTTKTWIVKETRFLCEVVDYQRTKSQTKLMGINVTMNATMNTVSNINQAGYHCFRIILRH